MRMACCQSENEMITMCSFFSRKRPLNGRLFIDVLYVPYLPFTVNISIASFPMIFIYVVIRSVSAKFTVVWPGHLHAIKFQIYTLRTRCRYMEATKKNSNLQSLFIVFHIFSGSYVSVSLSLFSVLLLVLLGSDYLSLQPKWHISCGKHRMHCTRELSN